MELREELKQLIIESLALEEITPSDIKDDEPLFNEGLGLDSIDALELGMALKRKYDITLESNKEENQKCSVKFIYAISANHKLLKFISLFSEKFFHIFYLY